MWHIHTEPSLLGIVLGMRNGLCKDQIHGGNASIVETHGTLCTMLICIIFFKCVAFHRKTK